MQLLQNLQNIDAEEAILGAILLDPSAITQVADALPIAAFSLSGHQEIYKAALALHAGGKPTDLMSVSTWLRDRSFLDGIGGPGRLATLADRTVSAVNIDQYAALVLDKWRRRQLLVAGQRLTELAQKTEETLDFCLDQAEQELSRIGRGGDDALPIGDSLAELFDLLESPQEGIQTGYYDLDGLVGGFHPGDLILLAGRPSMGKTAFAMEIAQSGADAGEVLFFSLEMSRLQLAQRLVSKLAGVNARCFRRKKNEGGIPENQVLALTRAAGDVAELPILIADNAFSLSEIRSIARKVAAKGGTNGLKLIIVDYIQLLGSEVANRNQEIALISRGLKLLAKELNVPLLCLSQLSRAVESRNDKRPSLSDLRDSGALEQDADIVMMLYRDDYYNPSSPDRGVAEVIVAKHRNGPTGAVRLGFDPELTKFKNLRREDA